MNRFLVFSERTTISCPSPHSGHSTKPSVGEFVPKITNLFFLAEYDRYPFVSKYWRISFRITSTLFLVILT